jgi:hypothetical protein
MRKLAFVKRYWKHRSIDEIDVLAEKEPPVRGLYALFMKRRNKFDVVYVGMTRSRQRGFRSRLWGHRRSARKSGKWNHFSVFEFKKDVSDRQIAEFEGMFREIFAQDRRAMGLNRQKGYGPLKRCLKKTALSGIC